MFAPAADMAKTHADQLRRDADTWRRRRQARLAPPVAPAPRHRRES